MGHWGPAGVLGALGSVRGHQGCKGVRDALGAGRECRD